MITLFSHSITGPSFILLYMAVVAFLVIAYWLLAKLNERGRKAASTAARNRADDGQKNSDPFSRPTPVYNSVIRGGNRPTAAYGCSNWVAKLDRKMSALYVFDPVTSTATRRTFASSKDTREAWLKKHELSNKSHPQAAPPPKSMLKLQG